MLHWILNKFGFRQRKTIFVAPLWNNIWAGYDGHVGTGKTVNETIGNLVFHHQSKFGIHIQLLVKDKSMKPLGESYVTIPESQYDLLMYKAGWSRK